MKSNKSYPTEKEVQMELGADVYESHIICEEIKDKGQEVEVDLIKA